MSVGRRGAVSTTPPRDPSTPTELLLAWSRGERSAFDRLVPLVHGELRRLARLQLRRERPGHTLQATALINEAYLRLIDVKRVRWQNRAHFLAMAARVMRRILVDAARRKRSRKRDAGIRTTLFDDQRLASAMPTPDLVELDDALDGLAAIDPRKVHVIEMRFFAGLTVEEAAAALKVSPDTVMRDWRLAKVWLLRELGKRKRETGP